MLTPEQINLRLGKMTASRLTVLVNGDETEVLNLWREMVGDPRYMAPDLSRVWPVQRGSATEGVNLRFYGYNTGHTLARHGEVVTDPDYDWACCTLDAWDTELNIAVESKDVGGNEERAKVIDRYQPQLHWIMRCTNTVQIALSIIEAGREPVIEIIDYDDLYGSELLLIAKQFMQDHVWTLSPPSDPNPPLAAPVIPERVVDMSALNSWCVEAITWTNTRVAAKDNAAAAKALKELVPPDARRAFGAGIEITRSRNNALTIKLKDQLG